MLADFSLRERKGEKEAQVVLIVSGRGWNYVGVAIVIVNCTVKHAVKHTEKLHGKSIIVYC